MTKSSLQHSFSYFRFKSNHLCITLSSPTKPFHMEFDSAVPKPRLFYSSTSLIYIFAGVSRITVLLHRPTLVELQLLDRRRHIYLSINVVYSRVDGELSDCRVCRSGDCKTSPNWGLKSNLALLTSSVPLSIVRSVLGQICRYGWEIATVCPLSVQR